MLGTVAQAMVALGFLLMVYNVFSAVRFIRDQRDVLGGKRESRLSTLILVFVVGFAIVYAIIFFQNFSEPTIGLILLSGSLFVFVVLQWIYRLVDSIKTTTISIAEALSTVIDARDRDLRGHSRHVEALALLIYDELPDELKQGVNRTNLRYAAIFHDIGKMGVPENVLNKPGLLTKEDWEVMRRHPRIGSDILRPVSTFDEIRPWIEYHHERMDGTGYYDVPSDQIPLGARIIAVADVFSAVFMRRPYKDPASYAETMEILRQASGTQLDPQVVEALARVPKAKVLACSKVLGGNAGSEE